jgi:hypothetical protein
VNVTPTLFLVSQAEHLTISVSHIVEIISDVLLYFDSSPFLSTGSLFCMEVCEMAARLMTVTFLKRLTCSSDILCCELPRWDQLGLILVYKLEVFF